MKKKRKILLSIIMLLCAATTLLPVIFVFTNSFMSAGEINSRYAKEEIVNEEAVIHYVEISFVPKTFTLDQYKRLFFTDPNHLRFFWNSVILIVPILVGQCVISPMAAYGFEYMSWKYKEILFFFYIVIMLLPLQLLMVPNFVVAGWLGIRESYLGIILPAMFHPLGVFLIRQQIKGFPKEALEAARLDGADEFQVFRQVVRPNMSSVIASLAILLFADNWNMIDQALVFIDDYYSQPMSVLLTEIADLNPQIFFVVSCFFMTPAVIVFLYGKDELIEGISLSGIKF